MKLDFLFLIPSYNRYDLLLKVIDRIEKQSSHLKYKIVVVDDCSNDNRYNNIQNISDNIIYHKNPVNNGRDKFYLTVSKLFNISKSNEAKYYVFLADDTLPSVNFIKHTYSYIDIGAKIINTSINKAEQYTNWTLKNWVDGCFVITHEIFRKINYDFNDSEIRKQFNKTTYGSGVYKAFTFRINKLGVKVHFPKHSMVYHMGHTDSVMHQEIRKAEQIHSYSFIDDCENCEIFRPELIKFLNSKLQIRVSNSIGFFKNKIIKKYGLIEYNNNTEPTVFFGMYNDNDYNAFINHKGEKVIVWGGTDALNLISKKEWHTVISKSQNVAISSFIHETLNSINIPNYIRPITPTMNIINTKPKGEFIYWYHNNDTKKKMYGGDIIDEIEKATKYKFIKVKTDSFNEEELKGVYEKCFLGLRLTEHDGLSNTVVELGLMGRYCIHNGDTPNSIKYDKNDVKSIIKLIDNEYSNIDKTNYDLSKKMFEYLNDNNKLHDLFLGFETTNQGNIQNTINRSNKNKRYEKNGMRNKVKPEPEKKVEIEKPKPTEPVISKKAIPINPTKLYIPTEKGSKTKKIHDELSAGRLRKGKGYNPRHKKW